MAKFTVTHEILCTADRFWSLVFDPEISSRFYLDTLGFPEYAVLDRQENDDTLNCKTSVRPKLSLPGPLLKLFGPEFRYVVDIHYDRNSGIHQWRSTPSTLADKIRCEGMARVEPCGDDRIRRIIEVEFEARIFGVGGLIESTAEKEIRESLDANAAFLNQTLAETA